MKKLTPAVHGPDSHRNFYLRIRHFCPLVSPTPSKRRAIYAESANPRREVRNSATKKRGPSLNHRKSPDPEDERGTSAHFSCFISTQLRLLCESCALLQPQTASPPAPSSTGSTTASLWLTGDGGATEGQPVCAPPRRLLGKEKPAEGKCDAG